MLDRRARTEREQLLFLDQIDDRQLSETRRVREAPAVVGDAGGVECGDRGRTQRQTSWVDEDEGRIHGRAASDQR